MACARLALTFSNSTGASSSNSNCRLLGRASRQIPVWIGRLGLCGENKKKSRATWLERVGFLPRLKVTKPF